jgi:hypothetical protein
VGSGVRLGLISQTTMFPTQVRRALSDESLHFRPVQQSPIPFPSPVGSTRSLPLPSPITARSRSSSRPSSRIGKLSRPASARSTQMRMVSELLMVMRNMAVADERPTNAVFQKTQSDCQTDYQEYIQDEDVSALQQCVKEVTSTLLNKSSHVQNVETLSRTLFHLRLASTMMEEPLSAEKEEEKQKPLAYHGIYHYGSRVDPNTQDHERTSAEPK